LNLIILQQVILTAHIKRRFKRFVSDDFSYRFFAIMRSDHGIQSFKFDVYYWPSDSSYIVSYQFKGRIVKSRRWASVKMMQSFL